MVEKTIQKFLISHGLSQEEIQSKSLQELQEIYTQGIKSFVQRFNSEKQQETQILKPQNPFKTLKDPQEIFDLPLGFFEHFSIEDVILMIHKHFRQIPMEQIQKIAKILFHSFQENILKEIRQKLHNIPFDEQESIMEIYEAQRDNIEHLIQINQQLELESFRSKFESILNLKTIIQANQEE
ncbi:hypothetical protein [Helicobacter pametensis]|uniref:hypothetical protein n=1 Tax=Helicobacter pametensis TaxID=95149 RepID=UPI0004883D4F|nr:hypothetical protein [Helicobacter pametensis]